MRNKTIHVKYYVRTVIERVATRRTEPRGPVLSFLVQGILLDDTALESRRIERETCLIIIVEIEQRQAVLVLLEDSSVIPVSIIFSNGANRLHPASLILVVSFHVFP